MTPIETNMTSKDAVLSIGRFCYRLLLGMVIAGIFEFGGFGRVSRAQEAGFRAPDCRARCSFQAPEPRQEPGLGGGDLDGYRDPETLRPISIYPSGRPVTAERLPIRQVAMQEVFAPPVDGNMSFGSSAPPLSYPDETSEGYGLVVPPPDASSFENTLPEQPVVGPGLEQDRTLFWWEADLPQSVLRNREAITMTLYQAMGLALNEAPELQILRSDWYIRKTELDRLNAAFDWTTFVDAVWNRDSTPVSSALDGATNRLRSRALNASGGVRRLMTDGSELELSQSSGLRNSNSQFISPNNQASTRLSLEYERPLLRGAGEDYNTSPQKLAAIEKDAAFDRFQAGIQDHLLEVATAYWTLVLRRGRFVQTVKSWTRSKEIADEMSARTEVDVTPGMLDRSRSEVATRLAASIEAEHDVVRAQDTLLRLIYGPRFTDFANNEIVTLTLPMRESELLQPEPHIERALQNRSEVHQMIRQVKAASVRYDVASSDVLPQLNMVLTSYVAGLRGDNDVGESFLSQFSEGEPGVGIGFNFEIPYRNRAALALAEQAQVAIRRVQSELQLTLGEVAEDVRNQVIQRNKYGSVLQQRWESLARARRILKYTETRREVLADGTQVADLYLENLLQMQGRLAAAEGIYLDAQIRYALADNGLLRAVSELETIADTQACQLTHSGFAADDSNAVDDVAGDHSQPGHAFAIRSVPLAPVPSTLPGGSQGSAGGGQNAVQPATTVSFGHTSLK